MNHHSFHGLNRGEQSHLTEQIVGKPKKVSIRKPKAAITESMTPTNGRKFSDEELINQFRATDDPILTAPELADHFGVSRQAVNDRLRKLWRNGILQRKPCASGYAYWLVSEVPEADSA